eukprot:TRINITY_DN15907_c0_g1_i1.p1 TRINITY_DN15907_c0_g1~~TRINITY_DN15907_c0_g1_i1.p1  ORF type:complete len:893 (+),score=154.72 TRINITY_DN15907_c0_g1_i1:120-2798(+)
MEEESSMKSELSAVLRATLSKEMKRIGGHLMRDVKEELDRFLSVNFPNKQCCPACNERCDHWKRSSPVSVDGARGTNDDAKATTGDWPAAAVEETTSSPKGDEETTSSPKGDEGLRPATTSPIGSQGLRPTTTSPTGSQDAPFPWERPQSEEKLRRWNNESLTSGDQEACSSYSCCAGSAPVPLELTNKQSEQGQRLVDTFRDCERLAPYKVFSLDNVSEDDDRQDPVSTSNVTQLPKLEDLEVSVEEPQATGSRDTTVLDLEIKGYLWTPRPGMPKRQQESGDDVEAILDGQDDSDISDISIHSELPNMEPLKSTSMASADSAPILVETTSLPPTRAGPTESILPVHVPRIGDGETGPTESILPVHVSRVGDGETGALGNFVDADVPSEPGCLSTAVDGVQAIRGSTTTAMRNAGRFSARLDTNTKDQCEVDALTLSEMEERTLAVKGKRDWPSRLMYAVHVGYFDYVIGLFLVVSAVVIGVETDVMTTLPASERPMVYRACDVIFFIVFLCELVLRVSIYRMYWFRMVGWQWNVFDLVVVVASAFSGMISLMTDGTDQAQDAIKGFGIVRMLKFCRIVRVFRMIRLIPELKAMVYLIAASMSSFFWTITLMTLMMYLLAVYYTDTAVVLMMQDADAAPHIKEKWGSIGRSVFSLFQAVTGGDDWCNFVDTWEKSNAGATTRTVNTLVFAGYISFAVLVMLNLVTGVFVDGAQRLIKEDRDKEVIKQARRLFVKLDGDASSSLSHEEFHTCLDEGTLDGYLEAVDLRRDEAMSLFTVLDVDQSGSLSLDEFLIGTLRMRGPAKTVDSSILKHMVVEMRNDIEPVLALPEQLENMLQRISILVSSQHEKLHRKSEFISAQVKMCLAVSEEIRGLMPCASPKAEGSRMRALRL